MGWDDLARGRHYATPCVGETADWIINSDTRQSRLEPDDIRKCFDGLKSQQDGAVVQEGQFGGGAGMTTHMFTGGTGTASRLVGNKNNGKQYTLGALCQSNYGILADLAIGGIPVGRLLQKENAERQSSAFNADGSPVDPRTTAGRTKDGSILILVITDAPLATHQLNRLARHATVGLAQVGTRGVGRTFSGDIFLAVSTAEHGPEQLENFSNPRPVETYETEVVKNESIDAFFYAVAEAVEEAILNCMVAASKGTVTMDGNKIQGLPVDRVRELLEKRM